MCEGVRPFNLNAFPPPFSSLFASLLLVLLPLPLLLALAVAGLGLEGSDEEEVPNVALSTSLFFLWSTS